MKDGFYRIAAAAPQVKVANCAYNREQTDDLIARAAQQGAAAVVFPELGLTGYTCGDLFLDNTLLAGAETALGELAEATGKYDILCGVGVPVAVGSALYNCIAVLKGGALLGLVPKRNVPNYGEFYELRHFTPFNEQLLRVDYAGFTSVPMGTMVFRCREDRDLCVGFEVCEDLWVPSPPSTALAEMGATVIMNASCSDETVGKADYRRQLVLSHSGRLFCAYAYADSGFGESTTDMVFAGHRMIAEDGSMLAESALFTEGLTMGDVDVERLVHERRKINTFTGEPAVLEIPFSYNKDTAEEIEIQRVSPCLPFVPGQNLGARCGQIVEMQCAGLKQRLAHIGARNAILGLSGGLDSTLALLVTAKTFDMLGLSRSGIHAVSMPCFGTTGRTKNNASSLAGVLGVDFREISILKSVTQHFEDIGHDLAITDVTFENAQARERTQLLMDLSNKLGGIVIGTGDLSELALGWATYNGDHMSMYGVNASIPKTLVRHLVAYFAKVLGGKGEEILLDILDTPVSPELLPPKDGEISQKTEDLVGPYELHDFFLYHMLRFGFSPDKIYRMALRSFAGAYDGAVIKQWLQVFYKRFFSQQFKRSCLPDGPKVGSVGLSPRGDFRMPSDASARLWLDIIDRL